MVRGRADTGRPFEHAGGWLLDDPPDAAGTMALDLVWVDLPSGAGWRAAASVPLDALELDGSGAAAFMLVFGPAGLLIVASDDDAVVKDVVRLCGTRAAEADVAYRADPGREPGLREALASARAAPAGAACR